MNIEKTNGLIVPVFTPMKDDGSIAYDRIPAYAAYIKNMKVQGAFVCGSSGEGLLMSVEERKLVVEAWEKYVSPDFKLLVHVGAASYIDSQQLAKHAVFHNAWAISSMGPIFLQPKNLNELVDYCLRIAETVPETPFYYYHIPIRTGLNFKMVDFLQEAKERIPNLAGIKFTSTDLMDMMRSIALDDRRWDILNGHDEIFLYGLTAGATGGIGTTFNYIPELYRRIMEAFNAGEMEKALELQKVSADVINVISRNGGGIAAGKAIMKILGFDLGPVRLPLKNIEDSFIETIKKELLQTRFFEFCSSI